MSFVNEHIYTADNLTNLWRMDFPILITWMNPLSFYGQQEWLFIFNLNFITYT